ncbi:MAG: deoxyribonuclease V [Candidatus Marinimicrobia bacterium]|nr:deoxyribonuclease V [Candidatus Neomarinimicrobiota bacterium]
MISSNYHPWDVSPGEAKAIQDRLRLKVVVSHFTSEINYVAGADVSFDKGSNLVYAAIVIMTFPDLNVVERRGLAERVDFPYIPGLLAFREGPPVSHTWDKLQIKPQVILFDAQGYAHPRRFGLASHLGVILDIPSIGCAKSVLVGKYNEPGEKAGEYTELIDKGEVVGAAVRSKDKVNPIFISIGHKVDLNGAIEISLACTRGYRIPEPTRQAHLEVNSLRRGKPISFFKSSEDQLIML